METNARSFGRRAMGPCRALAGGLFLLGVAWLGGCSAPPSPVVTPSARAEVHAPAPVTPDASGLHFLLIGDVDRSSPTFAAETALAQAMERGGYHVVRDVTKPFDVELVVRVATSGAELALPQAGIRTFDRIERVHFTMTAVARNRVVASGSTDFVMTNGVVHEADVAPALNAFGDSPKLHAFGERHRAERLAHP